MAAKMWGMSAILLVAVLVGAPALAAGVGGSGYRTSIQADEREIPVVVVSGTPYEMGYHYGALMQTEVQAFVTNFLAYVNYGFSNDDLDAAWATSSPYNDARYDQEMQGLADGAGVTQQDLHRVHAAPLLDSYSCSSVAAWGAATVDGHLYQTRDLDWDINAQAHEFPVVVLYMPTDGHAHINFAFAGMVGSHTGINDKGIVVTQMGDSPGSEMPYDLTGSHFLCMFRHILYDSDNLTEALDILQSTERIKRYHYVFGDGGAELRAVKIRAHAPETPPNDLVIWTDNDPTDEFAPEVMEDVVYNDEGRGAFPMLQADYGQLDAQKMINIANSIPMSGNVVDVVYDATDLEFWVSYADDYSRAWQEPYAHGAMKAFDGDHDGIGDCDETGEDADLDGTPNFLDTDSDDDGINDNVDSEPYEAADEPMPLHPAAGALIVVAIAAAYRRRRK